MKKKKKQQQTVKLKGPWLTLDTPEASIEVIYSIKPKSMHFFTPEPLLLFIFVYAVCDAMVSSGL